MSPRNNEEDTLDSLDLDLDGPDEQEGSQPQSTGKNYITPAGLQKLKDEFNELFHVERPKLVQTVAWAASNGDLSENGDYIYGKRRLREIDRRLKFLKRRLDFAEVVDPTKIQDDKVVFGSTVTVEDEDGKTFVYKIVGEDESDPSVRKVSWVSPIAKALLGKKTGDVVLFKRPAGDAELEIKKIEFLKIN